MSSKSILFDTIRFSTRNYIFENKDLTSGSSNIIGVFDNRLGIGTNKPAQNYLCTIDGDTLIRGNLTATSLSYTDSNLTYLVVDNDGSYPAVDIIQRGETPYVRMLSGCNVVTHIFQSDGNVGIGTTLAYDKLVVNGNIVASNIVFLGSYLEKRAIQLHPAHQTFVTKQAYQTDFTVFTDGIYDGDAASTAVYVDGYKLAYSNYGKTDYTMAVVNDFAANQTQYRVSLTEQVDYGSVVDITVLPYYLPPDANSIGLQPGWAVQNINSTFFSKNANSDVYILHNVGIGTILPHAYAHIHKDPLDLTPYMIVSDTNNNTKVIITANGSIGIGTSQPSQSFELQSGNAFFGQDMTVIGTLSAGAFIGDGSGIRNLPVGYWSSNLATRNMYYLQGNVGIGTTVPNALVHINWGGIGDVFRVDDYSATSNDPTPFIINQDGNVGIGTSLPRQTFDVASGYSIFGSNVGIGTTIPTQALHVNGNILSMGTVYASNISVIGQFTTVNTYTSNTEQMIIYNAGTGPALKVYQSGPQSIAEFYDVESGIVLYLGNGGNVGIGTSAPRQFLDIQGNGIIMNGGNVGIGTTLPRQLLDIHGGDLVVTTGRIGIGTTNPYHSLHVNYQSTFGGNIGIGTTIMRQLLDVARGSAIVSGNIGIGTTIPIQPLHVMGQTYMSSSVGIGTTIPRQYLDVQGGSMIVSGNIGIGTTIAIVPLHIVGQTYHSTNVGIGTTISRQLLDIQDGTLIVSGSGNIGVGTTIPLHSLHVGRQSFFNGNVGIGTTIMRQLLDIQGGSMIVSGNIGIGTTIPIVPLHVVGQSYYSTNVGIGTTIPRQLVDVQGGSIITSGNIGVGTTIPIQPLHVIGQSYYSTNVGIGTTIPRQLVDVQGGSMIVSGNIGIGTTLPIQPLHVIGQSYYSTNVGIGTTIPRQLFDIQGGSMIVSGNIGIGTTIPITPLHIVGQTYHSTNVGIGTTIPRQLLDIQGGSVIISGNIGVGTTIPIQPLYVIGQSYYSTNVGIGTTIPRQLVDVQGGDIILTGNVGIGTTLPTAYLDIKAGQSGIAPIVMRSGTLLSTPVNGSIEYDGTLFYGTPISAKRMALGASISYVLTGDYTISSPGNVTINTAYSMFGQSITVAANTTYDFYIYGALAVGTTSTNVLFNFLQTSATISYIQYTAWNNLLGIGTGVGGAVSAYAYNTNPAIGVGTIQGASTTATKWSILQGIIGVATGGTITPQIGLSALNTLIVSKGSYMRFTPISTNVGI
jgi:hypothetical protein